MVNKEVINTSLLHKRLAHISERGLNELCKQGLLSDDKLGDLELCKHCVHGKQTRVKFFIGIHNMLIASKDMVNIDKLKEMLKYEFEMKDLGNAKKILCMEIKQNIYSRTMHMIQECYANGVVQKFKMVKLNL